MQWLGHATCLLPYLVPGRVLADSRATRVFTLPSVIGSALNLTMVYCAILLVGLSTVQSRFPFSTLETPRNEAVSYPDSERLKAHTTPIRQFEGITLQ